MNTHKNVDLNSNNMLDVYTPLAHEYTVRQRLSTDGLYPPEDGDHPFRPMLWSFGFRDTSFPCGTDSVWRAHLIWFKRYRTHLL